MGYPYNLYISYNNVTIPDQQSSGETIYFTTSLADKAINSYALNAVQFICYNTSAFDITITSLTVTGDGSVGSLSSINTGSIVKNGQYLTLYLNISTSSVASKTMNIVIKWKNIIRSGTYNITVNYAVQNTYKLVITSSGTELPDKSNINLGSLANSSTQRLSYTLKNSGISKNVILQNIKASGDISIVSHPTYPFVLHTNNTNSTTLTVSLSTSNVGLKNGAIEFDYITSNAPPPSPTPPPGS